MEEEAAAAVVVDSNPTNIQPCKKRIWRTTTKMNQPKAPISFHLLLHQPHHLHPSLQLILTGLQTKKDLRMSFTRVTTKKNQTHTTVQTASCI